MYKRALLSFLLVLGVAFADANAATARENSRGTAVVNNDKVAPAESAQIAARAGVRQKVVSTPSTKSTVSSATTSSSNGNLAKRAATNTQQVKKPMAARAGATQKVVQTGQKVSTATTNSAVPQECQDAFYGCMDSFCMLDNASGGRCQCNDKIVDLDKILDEIMEMDKKSYAMATEGVERIQMGEAEEQLMAKVQNVTSSVQKNKSQTNTSDDDDFQQDSSDEVSSFINKKGNELYKASASMCIKSFPEQCKQYGQMLQLVYAQKIKSDCTAYENGLKQQKNESKQKLQSAQKALRDAASEEFKDQNKYGTSGECAVAFAQCMQNDAGCGSDYTECVTLAAKDNVASNKNGAKAKQTTIKGKVANITLSASTMESLLAKKEICQKVIKQCVAANEKQDVWTVFLRNAAPALKSAEEMAESNLRMQCIPTVADCFKTACKSTIDPKDPDGSYDMCLSNPATYKSLCKVQLEPCLNATGGTYEEPEKSTLWNGLLAALASMKVDACTTEVKKCLTDRCGEDYSGCVGLDTDSIVNLCPVQKLTACQTDNRFQGGEEKDSEGKVTRKSASDEIRDYVADIAQGLMVQIDNSMLSVCQKALNDSMMKVCGDTEKCDALVKDEKLGTRSLKYNICSFKANEANNTIDVGACKQSLEQISDAEWNEWVWIGGIDGLMYWGHIDYDFDKERFTTADEYIKLVDEQFGGIKEEEKQITRNVFDTEIASMQSAINNAINTIEADPTVTYCMTGREVQGFNAGKIGKKTKKVRNEGTGKMELQDASASRFPNLTDQVKRTIIAYALRGARDKYSEKYDAMYEQLMQDQVKAAEKIDHEKAAEAAKNTCETWAANSVLPRSKTPTNIWTWIGVAIMAAVCTVAAAFTGGAPYMALVGVLVHMTTLGLNASLTVATAITVTTAVAAGAAVAAAGGVGIANAVDDVHKAHDTTAGRGFAKLDQWNYRATITTIFDVKTGECTKETVYQNCAKESWTTGKCKAWDSEKTEVQKIKLL